MPAANGLEARLVQLERCYSSCSCDEGLTKRFDGHEPAHTACTLRWQSFFSGRGVGVGGLGGGGR